MLPWFARLVSFQTSRRGQPHGRNGCGCSRRCNFTVRPPSFSRIQSDLRRKAALATKRTRTVRRSRRDPGPALSFRLAASCRRASKNSFIHFHGAGAPSPEWSGCGLFLGQAPPSLRPSQYCGLPYLRYLRGPAQSRLLIRSCRERSCRPLGALVGLYTAPRRAGCWLLGTHVALHHAVQYPPPLHLTSLPRLAFATCKPLGLESFNAPGARSTHP